ncbi:MAG: hypothetical protein K8H88_05995 [Sandaracinaceae bacterium]|nr:hypothetical protein [Sandaracinaceae bacterium]
MTRHGTLLLGLLASGCYLSHEPPITMDAQPPLRLDGGSQTDAGPDAGADAARDAALPECVPDEPCDCFNGGRVDWHEVFVCPYEGRLSSPSAGGECGSVSSSWGSEGRLRARCPGTYRFCARATSFESSCAIVDVCTEGRVEVPGGGLRMVAPGGWSRRDPCAQEAATYGTMVCGRVEWTSDSGERGERDIDCVGFCGLLSRSCGRRTDADCGHIGGEF